MFLARFIIYDMRGRVLSIGLAIFLALIFVARPSWAIEPLTISVERVAEAVGYGLALLVLYSLLLLVAARKPRWLLRHWTKLTSLAFVIIAVQGSLAYFDGELPFIGRSNLGGELGLAIQGQNATLGVLRVGSAWVIALSIWAPSITKKSGAKAAWVGSLALLGFYRSAAIPLIRFIAKSIRRVVTRRGSIDQSIVLSDERDEIGKELESFFGIDSGPVSESGSEDSAMHSTRVPADEDKDLGEARPNHIVGPASTEKPARKPSVAAVPVVAWELPSLGILARGVTGGSVTAEHTATGELIEETLGQHGVEVEVAEIRPGPTVTMFGLVPGWNRRRSLKGQADGLAEPGNRVRVDSIIAREKDLALALAAPSLRIEAPVPGESVVGVEVPNRTSIPVPIRAVMESPGYQDLLEGDGLPVALGLATAGEPVTLDLRSMPHLLIAGATGAGKSVCINTIISSLVMHQDPSKVRLLLIDPKRVELTPYNGLPHLVTPVVVEPDRVVRLLRGAIQEMLRRYRLFEEAKVRNIQSYNVSSKKLEPMPYFVICIDELADLMMTASFDVEQSVCRLAQLGRATGIHLVVATQRPSVDVVTGLIKANFPSRIAFSVASQVDSRTILDSVGAERLLGRGDMLFLSSESPKARRVQGAFISETETEALASHWHGQPPAYLPDIPLEQMASEAEQAVALEDAISFDENDSLYDRALQLATASRQLSVSLLQRKLRIGYPRAARLMDQLEAAGVVSPAADPGKPRDVLLSHSEI